MFDEGLPTTLLGILNDVEERYSELLITGVRTDCVVDVDPDCGKSLSRSINRELQTTTGGAGLFQNQRKRLASLALSNLKRSP